MMHSTYMLRLVALFLSLFSFCCKPQEADFIIFSFDRPLQLYALLESTTCLVTGLKDIHVVYRSSNDRFEQGYGFVKESFPYVYYYKQSENPRDDFKPLTLLALDSCTAGYILFGVDDIVVKDYIDIAEATSAMEEHNTYGCYLRLSPSIDYLYSWKRSQQVPKLKRVKQGYLWQFSQASVIADWGYPHTVDMAIYKKCDIEADFKSMDYHNPNTLEARWSCRADKIRKLYGFCYEVSKIVNLPLNLVQNSYNNPHMMNHELTPDQLLNIFLDGKKMDIWPLFQMVNRSCHMEYNPLFVERG